MGLLGIFFLPVFRKRRILSFLRFQEVATLQQNFFNALVHILQRDKILTTNDVLLIRIAGDIFCISITRSILLYNKHLNRNKCLSMRGHYMSRVLERINAS